MIKYKYVLLNVCVSLLLVGSMTAQETTTTQDTAKVRYTFTLEDVIRLAKEQSNQAIMARHNFRASYYTFRSYKAQFLPKLTLTTNPTSYRHSIQTIQTIGSDGKYQTSEINVNTFTSDANLALRQNIGLTGGTVSLGSTFRRVQNFDATGKKTDYTTNPVSLSLNQPLNGYNELKWSKKIEPVQYDMAKQRYLSQMETISNNAVMYFFGLASQKVQLKMAETNYENNKKLYETSLGRYNIGTIAEDALLKMELSYMQSEKDLNEARIDLEDQASRLRSFLGFKNNVEIDVIVSSELPQMQIKYVDALNYALSRSPEILSYNLALLNAQRNAAEAKSRKGITMSINGSYGFNKSANTLKEAYRSPFDDAEGVSIGITVPILDWNQSRDAYRNTLSLLEAAEIQKEQNEIDFRQQVYLQVARFNLQKNQVRIAAKADTIAQKAFEVSMARYYIGKVTVTDLNIASSDKDNAKTAYYQALQQYWQYYYTVRQLTLFDFEKNVPLETDFEAIVGE